MEVEINGQTVHEGKSVSATRQLRGVGKTVERTWPTPRQLMAYFIAQRMAERQATPSVGHDLEEIITEFEQSSSIAIQKYLQKTNSQYCSRFLPYDYTGK